MRCVRPNPVKAGTIGLLLFAVGGLAGGADEIKVVVEQP